MFSLLFLPNTTVHRYYIATLEKHGEFWPALEFSGAFFFYDNLLLEFYCITWPLVNLNLALRHSSPLDLNIAARISAT